MRYEDLVPLSPVVRKEVLSGELNRRVKAMGVVPPHDIDAVVDSLVNLSLSEVVQGIQDPTKLADQVAAATQALRPPPPQDTPEKSPSPAASQDSRLLDPSALNATASAPEHPSTPISVSASLSTPPRTSSPSGSVHPMAERERLYAAVRRLESSRQEELTDLLMSLSKRERALCLFNVEVLRAKLADAKLVLDVQDEELPGATDRVGQAVPGSTTPQLRAIQTISPAGDSEQPNAATPTTTTYTLASLARLPAAEIIRLTNSPMVASLSFLPKPDPLVIKATDEFIDSLLDKPITAQKQALGDKLHKVVKNFGIKGAPKLTITLLDSDDLRALAHLMNSYPAVLKEKAILAKAATTANK
jgi:polyadenylate-binding protein